MPCSLARGEFGSGDSREVCVSRGCPRTFIQGNPPWLSWAELPRVPWWGWPHADLHSGRAEPHPPVTPISWEDTDGGPVLWPSDAFWSPTIMYTAREWVLPAVSVVCTWGLESGLVQRGFPERQLRECGWWWGVRVTLGGGGERGWSIIQPLLWPLCLILLQIMDSSGRAVMGLKGAGPSRKLRPRSLSPWLMPQLWQSRHSPFLACDASSPFDV